MGISNLHFGLGCLVDPASYLGSKILPGVAVFTTDTVSAKKYPFAGMAVAPKLRGEVGYHIILIHHPKSVGELLIEGFFEKKPCFPLWVLRRCKAPPREPRQQMSNAVNKRARAPPRLWPAIQICLLLAGVVPLGI